MPVQRWIFLMLLLLGGVLLAGLAPGCGSGDSLPGVSATRSQPVLSGTYRVEGVTTVLATGDSRPIEGSVILVQDGDTYTATFHLSTTFPSADGNINAQVIGKGEGRVEGERLVGTAETQILNAMLPGIDAKFPFLPQMYGPRVVSTSVGELKPDGSIELEIETRAAEGERYANTRTTMRGSRAAPTRVEGFPPVGAERQEMQAREALKAGS